MHKIKIPYLLLSTCLILSACTIDFIVDSATKLVPSEYLSDLPIAISNNAVSSVEVNNSSRLYSFLGLEAGKTWSDVSKKVFRFSNGQWEQLADAPVEQGRLASVAVTVRNKIYLFGGYTVSEDHSEISTPEALRFDPLDESYTRVTDIPIPTDDAVALVYQDRYIYLISGWHNRGNISLVQVYDVVTDYWQQATQFPGSPVFGHSGGLVGNKMIVCDGVKINYPELSAGAGARREFVMSDECYQGLIDTKDPTRIHWSVLPSHPFAPRYRAAAVGDTINNRVLFLGGSNNPYNFNGIGYNGEPSESVNSIFAFDFDEGTWLHLGATKISTMDHRGLLTMDNKFITVGGMDSQQNVLTKTHAIAIPSKD